LFQPAEQADRLLATVPADRRIGLEGITYGGPLGPAEQTAEVFDRQVRTTFAGRLALRQAGDRRADAGGDAAGTATGATVHLRGGLGVSLGRTRAILLPGGAFVSRLPCPVPASPGGLRSRSRLTWRRAAQGLSCAAIFPSF